MNPVLRDAKPLASLPGDGGLIHVPRSREGEALLVLIWPDGHRRSRTAEDNVGAISRALAFLQDPRTRRAGPREGVPTLYLGLAPVGWGADSH